MVGGDKTININLLANKVPKEANKFYRISLPLPPKIHSSLLFHFQISPVCCMDGSALSITDQKLNFLLGPAVYLFHLWLVRAPFAIFVFISGHLC